jgi:hypothetical protein
MRSMATRKRRRRPKATRGSENQAGPMVQGRPTKYNEKVAQRILHLIATTPQGIRSICNSNEDFPSPSTVFLWLLKSDHGDPQYAGFSEQYARAREQQKQVLFDEIIVTAYTTEQGRVAIFKKGKGKKSARQDSEIRMGDMTQHRRLKIDSLKWVLSKLDPEKYGDKLQLDGREGLLGEVLEEFRSQRKQMEKAPPEDPATT